MSKPTRQLLSIKDIAQALEVHPNTVRHNIKRWGLLGARVMLSSQLVRFKRKEVVEAFRSRGIDFNSL